MDHTGIFIITKTDPLFQNILVKLFYSKFIQKKQDKRICRLLIDSKTMVNDNNFIKCICGATAGWDKNKKAHVCSVCLTETPLKERSNEMGKKGICKECKREMSIVARGLC